MGHMTQSAVQWLRLSIVLWVAVSVIAQCDPGTGGPDCAECAAGFFKGTTDTAPCTLCPLGKWSASGATDCTSCPDGYHTGGRVYDLTWETWTTYTNLPKRLPNGNLLFETKNPGVTWSLEHGVGRINRPDHRGYSQQQWAIQIRGVRTPLEVPINIYNPVGGSFSNYFKFSESENFTWQYSTVRTPAPYTLPKFDEWVIAFWVPLIDTAFEASRIILGHPDLIESYVANNYSTSAASCQSCAPGYGGTVGDCAICTPGKFARVPGIAPCENCPRDTYAEGYGATICDLCPDGTGNGILGAASQSLWL